MVELASIVEAKNVFMLLGEERFRLHEKFEVGITLDDAFKVGNAIGFGLHELGSGAFFPFAFLLELFGGFGDKEGGGKWRSKKRKSGFSEIGNRVLRFRERYG